MGNSYVCMHTHGARKKQKHLVVLDKYSYYYYCLYYCLYYSYDNYYHNTE